MIPSYIKELEPYEPPLIREGEHRLFMNENLFGPATSCCDAIKNISKMEFCRYTHNGDYQLAERIAELDGIKAENISLNHGSSEVLKQIFSVIIEEGDVVLAPTPGWSYYNDAVSLVGGGVNYYTLKEENNFKYDVKYLQSVISKVKAKAVVITSPNMPTGNKIAQEELEEILKKERDTYFIVDEAYWGFDNMNVLNVSELIKKYNNLIITRTFSKFFGLASERIGWLITNELLCREIKKGSPLFGISFSAQMIALAAIDSKDYYEKIRQAVGREIIRFKNSINDLKGFYVYPSSANFILIKVPKNHNKSLVEYLEKRGYLIRDCSKYGIDFFVRISIGTPEIDKRLISEIKDYAKKYC